jgi:putative membrane protein
MKVAIGEMDMREQDIAIIAGIGALLVILFASSGWGMMVAPGMMHWGWHWNGSGIAPWWGIIMMMLLVLIIAGTILFILWILRRIGATERGLGGPIEDRAINILRERYARGEVSREEFEQMRQELEGARHRQ